MTTPLDSMALWRRTLGVVDATATNAPRERLRQSFLSFRERVAHLVSTIGAELPGLTVHDITHLDALWRVADVIAGDDYPINPAEAYVLGGAFLLHDAAHVAVAYPDGLAGIKRTVQWQDLIAQRYGGKDPDQGSSDEKFAIFQVLRHVHADRARELPAMQWTVPGASAPFHLVEDQGLREYYGDLIGEIASSHHWPPHKVAERFAVRRISCPAALLPADWEVDALKLALLLRTADAAHLDAQRAPWFLFALRQPQGISQDHWGFQAKMGQPSRTKHDELRLSSGSPFAEKERNAWWLAFDTARMVDRELRSAHDILREEGRQPFKVARVLGVESAQAFAKIVPVKEWEPVDVMPSVSDVPKLIERLGGTALYGEDYTVPLRELLQNALDAVSALRALGGLGYDEGDVEVALKPEDEVGGFWTLSVTDTGIGMSMHVLSNVLPDFGSSFWGSDIVREEIPGLSNGNFRPIGKFGIGFYSVFMLGQHVTVTTRRFQPSSQGQCVDLELRFDEGLASRPVLSVPRDEDRLKRPGTRVAVSISASMLSGLAAAAASAKNYWWSEKRGNEALLVSIQGLIGRLCPSSHTTIYSNFVDIGNVTTKMGDRKLIVAANDWTRIEGDELCRRLGSAAYGLLPLTDDDGRILGRVGFPGGGPNKSGLTIAYGGIRCGMMNELAGLVESPKNSSDAKRSVAVPAGSIHQWQNWAKEILRAKLASGSQLIALAVLLPEEDLPIFRFEREWLNRAQLAVRLSRLEEFALTADASVELERRNGFVLSDRYCFVLLPNQYSAGGRILSNLASFLDLPIVDFADQLCDVLRDVWGQWKVHIADTERVLGNVEIYKRVR